MPQPIITELIVDARGAAAGTATYLKAMTAAQAAVDKLMDRERALQGVTDQTGAVLTGGAQSTSRLAAAFDKLRGAVDPAMKLQIAQQKELERAMVTTDAAVRRGLASQQEAAAIIAKIRTKQIADVEALAAAEQREGAIRVANDNHFNTANIAAQFQDVGVTAAMGMNPLQIALQQGTQLSAAFGTQGLKGVVTSLGAAFASLVSPISLITIAAVALGAAGIQALLGIGKEADKATTSLEDHKKWLDEILFGYDAARKAAQGALDVAQKLPQGVVQSDLAAKEREQEAAIKAVNDRIAEGSRLLQDNIDKLTAFQSMTTASGTSVMEGVDPTAINDFKDQLGTLRDLGVTATTTASQLEAAEVKVRGLQNSADDPALRKMAGDIFDLLEKLRQAQGELKSTQAATAALQAQAAQGINLPLGIGDAIDQLKRLTPNLKTPDQQVDEIFAQNAPQARTISELQSLVDWTNKAHAAIADQKAQQDAEKAATKLASATNQLAEAYKNIVASAKEREAQAQIEAKALDMTEQAAARLRAEHDLLNQAVQAGIDLDSRATEGEGTKRDQLMRLADASADAETHTKSLNEAIDEQAKHLDQLRSAAETAINSLMDLTGMSGTPLGSGISGALSPLLRGDWIGALIGGITGLFTGFIQAAKEAQQARDALAKASGDIDEFFAKSLGQTLSGAAAAMDAFEKQGQQFIDLANKAGNTALAQQLAAANDNYKATLGTNFTADLQSSLNTLRGQGFLNDVAAAQAKYNQRLADAAYLGVSAAGAQEELSLSLQKIATDANLTASQILVLAAQFPALAGSLTALIGVTGGPDLEQLQQNVDNAQSALRDAYNEQASLFKSTSDAARSAAKNIRDFLASLKTGPNSGLSPFDQLQAAQAQFAQVSQGALAGNKDDLDKLTGVSQDYLDAARSYYASSTQYFQILDSVEAILNQTANTQDSVASTADMQLAALNQQVGSLISIDNGVKSVADAIAALAAAQGALAAGQAANQNGVTPTSAIDTLYQTVLGRPADAAGEAYWTSQVAAAGGTLTPDITRAFIAAGIANGETVDPTIRAAYGMANGGIVGNGIWGRDSVLASYAGGGNIALAGGEYVMPARQTAMYRPQLEAMRGGWGANDNGAEIRALRADVAKLQAALVEALGQNAAAVAGSVQQNTAAVENQTSEQTRMRRKRAA